MIWDDLAEHQEAVAASRGMVEEEQRHVRRDYG